MKRFLIVALLWAVPGFAVTMNFTGTFRSEANFLDRPTLVPNGPPKKYLSARALLSPNLVIDDHFSIKSQWSLLASPGFTPSATTALGSGQGGYIFGDVGSSALVLNRAWLEWTSDFGVFRIGRMPIAWGYGLLWDAGNRVWDDYQTTQDRIEYRLHLGNVVGALAYSKARKIALLGDADDQEFYTIYLQYNNQELDVEGGILFEKQARATGQQAALIGTANPFFPALTTAPFPSSNNVVDVYLKKKVSYFTFGGEVGWLTGDAFDFNGDGAKDSLNAVGAVLSATFELHSVKAFLELLYASGDSNVTAGHLNGFVLLHRNRRPGIILGRQLLGAATGNTAGQGSVAVYGKTDASGNAQSFSGAIYARPGFRVDWSRNWASGFELIFARKAATAAGESSNLGVELDIGTDYSVYKNFDLGLTLGYLFSGDGLNVASPKGVFGLQITAALKF